MKEKQDNPFLFFRLGHEANKLAAQVTSYDDKLAENQQDISEAVQNYEKIQPQNNMFVIVAMFSSLAWAVITTDEYFVSRDMYAVILHTTKESIKPALLAVAIALYAVFLSCAIGEFFHPIFTSKTKRPLRFPYMEAILNLKAKHIDKRYLLLGFGILATLATAGYLYALSEQRVALESVVHGLEQGQESLAEILIPSVLFLLEVVTGVFLPFTTCLLYCRFRMKTLKHRRDQWNRERDSLSDDAIKCWDTYLRELGLYNRQHPGNSERQIPASRELRRLIERRFGQSILPESGSVDSQPADIDHQHESSEDSGSTAASASQINDDEDSEIPPGSLDDDERDDFEL